MPSCSRKLSSPLWTRGRAGRSSAPATVAAREAKGRGPHPILQVTNALARSVTTWADRNEAGIGSNLVYAAIHQFGGDAGRVTRSKFLHGG
ncbi:phage virion morphogenesis protein, partial [Pseudomonas aeruginosa]